MDPAKIVRPLPYGGYSFLDDPVVAFEVTEDDVSESPPPCNCDLENNLSTRLWHLDDCSYYRGE